MAVETSIKVAGINDAIRQLNKIEPGLRKQFQKDVQEVAGPVLDIVRQGYRFVPLSGMQRTWQGPAVRGRKVFPLTLEAARKGIVAKLDTDRRRTGVIVIQQNDPGWAIFETAGRANPGNKLDRSLGDTPETNKTRLFGRIVFANRDKIEREIERMALKVVNQVNDYLRKKAA